MTDPFADAARRIFAETADSYLENLGRQSVEQLNWSPPWGETNSAAVIATHAFGSTRSWFACAMGAPLPERDRDAEFRVVATSSEDLVSRIRAVRSECEAYLAGEPALAWEAPRASHTGEETGAWALLHGVEHLREHLGQLWLTDELYRVSAPS